MHSEYLTLLEDAIRQPDLAKSMQRYQLAVHIAKVHLNLAARRSIADALLNGDWYRENSYIQQQAEVNKPKKKKAKLRLMEGSPSKINPPNSHLSNPIHKEAMKLGEQKKKKGAPHYPHFFLPSFSNPPMI